MAEEAKVFIHLDKVKATAHIESVVATAKGLKAGQFVNLKAISEDYDGEIYEFENATAKGSVDGLVVPVHVDKGYPDFDEAMMVVAEGKAARVYIIEKGNTISFHEDMVKGVKAGDKLAIGTDGYSLVKTEVETEVVALAVAERYMSNIGDVITVRFV